MYRMHTPLMYTENVCILAVNAEKMLQSRYICIYACNRHKIQITCTLAIQWVMKVYVNRLLIYNVPHLLYLSVYKWRFSVNRKRSRTAAQLLGRNTWQHSSEMWITCTVAIHLVRQLDLICLLICNVPHAQSSDVYRKRVHIGSKCWENATESLHLHISM